MRLRKNNDNHHKTPKKVTKSAPKKERLVDLPIKSDIHMQGWQKEQKAWKKHHKDNLH